MERFCRCQLGSRSGAAAAIEGEGLSRPYDDPGLRSRRKKITPVRRLMEAGMTDIIPLSDAPEDSEDLGFFTVWKKDRVWWCLRALRRDCRDCRSCRWSRVAEMRWVARRSWLKRPEVRVRNALAVAVSHRSCHAAWGASGLGAACGRPAAAGCAARSSGSVSAASARAARRLGGGCPTWRASTSGRTSLTSRAWRRSCMPSACGGGTG